MAKRVKRVPGLPNITPDVRESLTQVNRALFQDGIEIAYRLNLAFPKDGTEPFESPLPLQSVATGSLPAAADYEGNIIYDSTTNTLKYSNGTAWVSLGAPSTLSVVVQTFTSGGTYTPTSGMAYCLIEVQAPGGGSGGADGTGGGSGVASAGGGGGEYAKGRFTAADIGANQTVTIGSVGAAGNATGGNGGAGGNSSVGALITANGGGGGTGTGNNSVGGTSLAGGAGGTGGSGGFLRIPGQAGGPSWFITDNATFSCPVPGVGGNAFLGHGAQIPLAAAITTAPISPVAGLNYGGGASGRAIDNTTGAAGAAGGASIVIVTEFVLT